MPLSDPSKANAFETVLTEKIRTGVLKPNDRIPPTSQLAAEHGLSLREVQRALTRLAAQGLIARAPRRGTVVTGKTPTAVLLFGWNLDLEPCYMPRQVAAQLRLALEKRGIQLEVIHDLYAGFVNDRMAYADFFSQLYGRLKDIQPAGFLEYQFNLSRISTVYSAFRLPTVHYGRAGGLGDVTIDRNGFMDDVLGHLAGEGCRRITYLRRSIGTESTKESDEVFWKGIKQHKFAGGEILELFHDPSQANAEALAQSLVESWVDAWRQAPAKLQPDALIVTDDILLRGVARGLLKRGVETPDELKVVYLAHKEIVHHYGIEATRYEISIQELAEAMAELFVMKLARERLPKLPLTVRGRFVPPPEEPDFTAPPIPAIPYS